MLKLNYKSGVPICDQIVNGFVRMKALGLVESGEQLPSVRALAMELGVAFSKESPAFSAERLTNALNELQSDGVIADIIASYGLSPDALIGG